MTIFRKLFRKNDERAATQTRATRTMSVTRRFVETGDERCPLAGIWLPLNEGNTSADDPEIPWPAFGMLLLAGHS